MSGIVLILKALAGGLVVGLAVLGLRGRRGWVSAFAGGGVAVAVFLFAWVPDSLRAFSSLARRTGVENLLREFQQEHPGCLIVGGACSDADLQIVRARGCSALNGRIDPAWRQPCLLPTPVVELTKTGGLAIAVLREDGIDVDIWLLRADSLLAVGISDAHAR